ncbi:MAG TPA: hypothetical protein VFZ53_34090 [Polyangiaceae bacterium]
MRFQRIVPGLLEVFVVASLVLGTGCGKQEQMMAASGRTPAADGGISFERGDNGNTEVEVKVKHLAPPGRLAPDATIYLVWVDVEGVGVQSVGALELDDDLVGELEFVTPHRVFRVFVTPEASRTVATPSHRAVFSADVDAR